MITKEDILCSNIIVKAAPTGWIASRNGWSIERATMAELIAAINDLLPLIMALEPWLTRHNGRGAAQAAE